MSRTRTITVCFHFLVMNLRHERRETKCLVLWSDDFKRSRTGGDNYVEDQLEACIFRMGEIENNQFQQQTVEANIESSVGYIIGEIMNKRSQVISLLLECASKLPEKLSIYTTLIGLLNLRNAPFVEEVILI